MPDARAEIEVIIPAFNAGEFLEETVLSVFAQTLPPGVVTVVNDRSTDGTRRLAMNLASRAPGGIHFQVLDNEGPQGPSAARNTALRREGPAWVLFQDADDLMLPEQLQRLQHAVAGDPQCVMAFGDTEVFSAAGVLFPSLLKKSGVLELPATRLENGVSRIGSLALFDKLCRSGVFGTSACLLRREAVKRAGYFDESMWYCEDTDLFLRLSLLGEAHCDPVHVSRKRTHEHNLSHARNALKFEQGTVRVLSKLLGLVAAPAHHLPALDTERRSIANANLNAAVSAYLWNAAQAGWPAFLAAAKEARASGRGALALRAALWVHACRAHLPSRVRAN